MINRLHNLDYLRGIAAFGIMIYHFSSWSFGSFSADTFMGRLGIYGVSIFYVLSGLTLHHVYYNKMKPSVEDVLAFFKKRVLRIFPLLWLVTIISIVISRKVPNFMDLFLNLTGLFGFVKWDRYFSPGVWSIGNELVFYVFFPFFVYFSKTFRSLMILLSLIILGVYLYFAFVILDPNLTLVEQWKDYVNPLDQVFVFLGGFLIGFFLRDVKISASILLLSLTFGVLLFMLYPVAGDPINLVTGMDRSVFTLCCFLISISFYKLQFKLPTFIHKPLSLLGEASYSVYLLHPIIWTVNGMALEAFEQHSLHPLAAVRVGFSVIVTLVVSYYVYHYFEKYFMRLK